jgi:acetylornithine/succinyldiaminopimelate/putrescine aminotransferase
MWYHEQEDVPPDILTTAKGLSGGVYPITATLMRADIHAFFDGHPFIHVSTFGGSEVGCAAANAVLDTVTAPGFLQRVADLGERFEAGFAGMPFTLRRRGMFMGFAFAQETGGLAAAHRLFQAGVYAFPAGNDPSVLQFLPPLTITDDEAGELIGIVRSALA